MKREPKEVHTGGISHSLISNIANVDSVYIKSKCSVKHVPKSE